MKKRNEEQILYWGTASCCDSCAHKLSRSQEVYMDENSTHNGRCTFCMAETDLNRYIFRPLPKIRYRSYTGGGERARAVK